MGQGLLGLGAWARGWKLTPPGASSYPFSGQNPGIPEPTGRSPEPKTS